MKRVVYLIVSILYISCLVDLTAVFAHTSSDYYYEIDAPRSFKAYGMQRQDDSVPFNRLHNMLEFEFADGKEVHETFTAVYGSNDEEYGPSSHTLEFDLVYDKDALENYEVYFITGTFIYTIDQDDEITEYEGTVTGSLVTYVTYRDAEYDLEKNAILLYMAAENAAWNWEMYLQTTDDSWISYNDEYAHEESPHLPSASKQTDIAVGVGISSFGVVLLNLITKTTVSGAVSLNLPAAAVSGSSAAVSSASASSAASASSSAGAGGGHGIIFSLKRIFMNILHDLRDMLTDEGRSYASGKLTEKIEQTININR